jgi:hypothetical protein
MNKFLNILLENWPIVFTLVFLAIGWKKISPALFGLDGKMDFQELVKATVWVSFLILMLKSVTIQNYQLNLELLKTLLLYMTAMGGFKFGQDWVNKAYDKKDNEGTIK